LVMSRAIPGSRLPLYVAAGALRLPVRLFARTTAVCSALWVSAIFAIWRFVPKTSSGHQKLFPWFITAVVLFAPWLLGKTAVGVFQRLRATRSRKIPEDRGALCAL
jgi:membrane protein DedA with SNARE-associated domain